MNIARYRIILATLIFPLLAQISYCGEKGGGLAISSESTGLNEAALLFAGRDIPGESKLYQYTSTPFYRAYRAQMVAGWNRMQKPNLEKITAWWGTYRPSRRSSTVLYPFSGPDIMNALTFFPDADTYLLFGLEQPGVIPDPHAMTADQITRGLNGLRNSLGDILHMNFFKTEGMAAELSSGSFNSITGLIMYFLSTNGYTVIEANRVAIDAESAMVPGAPADNRINWQKPPRSRVPGVEIVFRKGSGKRQKVRYFMLNVIDYALRTSSPNFIPFLEKEGPYDTIIKSASYLMHNDREKFTRIRAAVLSTTRFLVQDDSGVPLRYFKADTWKLGFHGYYQHPIGLFANRVQPDLRKAMKERSTGVLPFSYGYDYLPGQSNLMTAERIR